MLRSLWQTIKDRIYDTVNDLFYTQAEIDDNISDMFADEGIAYGDTPPAGYTPRGRGRFLTPEDALAYIDRGIPREYVFVQKVDFWDVDDSGYHVWVDG